MRPELYITSSELLTREFRDILEAGRRVVVSGQPLLRRNPGGGIRYFDECDPAEHLVLDALSVVIKNIPDVGHRHLRPEFRGEYPALYGVDAMDYEYHFGMRSSLGFTMRPLVPEQ